MGSYETVARMLDEVASVPGTSGVLLTFDDFVAGVEKFGLHIQPKMKRIVHGRLMDSSFLHEQQLRHFGNN